MFTWHSSYCSQRWLSQEFNGHASLYSCGVQLIGNSCKDFHHCCQTKPFHSRKHFQQCPSSSVANAMNTNSAFTGSYTDSPLWYQQFDISQFTILRGGHPIVNFDTADSCRLYVTKMEAMNFQDDVPPIWIDTFTDNSVLVFDLSSMQDATENCYYTELVGELLRLELNFIFPLAHVTEVIVLGKGMSSVAVDKFGVVGKKHLK